MPEALRVLPYLLVPVLALLFLNLRLSRKLRYPHDLLKADDRKGAASFLFRTFRLYHDVLLDALIAAVVAFAIFPPARPRAAAVVIDGSRAMLSGFGEHRPLAQALRRLRDDPALREAEPFLLTFDAATSGSRLRPIRSYVAEDVDSAIQALRRDFDFFSLDYGALAELREKGYGDITLLTDQLRVKGEGFRTVPLGFAVTFAAYPSAARFDRASGTWLIALVETGPRAALSVSAWDRGKGAFLRLAPGRFALEEGVAGRVVRLPAPGLYLLSLKGPYGLDDIDLPLRLPSSELSMEASGPFSERMRSVFPETEASARVDASLVDEGFAPATGSRALVSARVREEGTRVLDPARTGGALVAVGSRPGVDLTLGPSSVANEELVLAYDHFLSQRPLAFSDASRSDSKELIPVGTAYLANERPMPLPRLPQPSQFFETRPLDQVVLPPPASARWPWLVALACLSLLKLWSWARLTGKPLFLRDQAVSEGRTSV